jgi:hypothetical protein
VLASVFAVLTVRRRSKQVRAKTVTLSYSIGVRVFRRLLHWAAIGAFLGSPIGAVGWRACYLLRAQSTDAAMQAILRVRKREDGSLGGASAWGLAPLS